MELDTEYMYVVEGLMQLKYETQDIIRKYSSELTFGAEQHIIDLYNEIIADKKSKGEWEKALEEVSGVVA